MSNLKKNNTRHKRQEKQKAKAKRHQERKQMEFSETKNKRISDERLYAQLLEMAVAAGREGQIRPEDVAMTLSDDWQAILPRIRLASKKLAEGGAIILLRKGKPADPEDFKGVYRVRIAS